MLIQKPKSTFPCHTLREGNTVAITKKFPVPSDVLSPVATPKCLAHSSANVSSGASFKDVLSEVASETYKQNPLKNIVEPTTTLTSKHNFIVSLHSTKEK